MALKHTAIFYDCEKTFGVLKFLSYEGVRNVFDNEKGEKTDEIKSRVYRLISERQGEVIEVTIPPEVAEKNLKKGATVVLKGLNILPIAKRGYGSDTNNYIQAEDLLEVGGATQNVPPVSSFGKKEDGKKE